MPQILTLAQGGQSEQKNTPTTTSEEDMQIVTTTANKGQWLLTGDGTLVGMPNTEYVRVAIRMCDKKMTGLNQREVDVMKDIVRRIKEARN